MLAEHVTPVQLLCTLKMCCWPSIEGQWLPGRRKDQLWLGTDLMGLGRPLPPASHTGSMLSDKEAEVSSEPCGRDHRKGSRGGRQGSTEEPSKAVAERD